MNPQVNGLGCEDNAIILIIRRIKYINLIFFN